MRVHVMWIWPAETDAEIVRPAAPPARAEHPAPTDQPSHPEQTDAPVDAMTLLRLLRELRGYL